MGTRVNLNQNESENQYDSVDLRKSSHLFLSYDLMIRDRCSDASDCDWHVLVAFLFPVTRPCVVLQARGETAYVSDVIRDRLEYPDLKRKVTEVYRKWRSACDRCELVIENKGSSMSLVQELKRENIHAIAIDPQSEKVMRMNAQTARIEAGSVFLAQDRPVLSENHIRTYR